MYALLRDQLLVAVLSVMARSWASQLRRMTTLREPRPLFKSDPDQLKDPSEQII